ncbi:hypothetical protein PSH66_07565 [Pseudomonas sp. FP597]|nr:hypothetical protein [Pseudomonas sp. FP597]WLI08181.1 hypothetical protein PSH66_07565 [Pseudomonas sp. FP597]
MLEPGQHTPKPILRQVVGWVLVLPFLVALVRLPYPLGLLLAPGSIAASAYGAWFAWHHASRRVCWLASLTTALNMVSFGMIGTASLPMGLYYISWLYWYPPLASWIHWNF